MDVIRVKLHKENVYRSKLKKIRNHKSNELLPSTNVGEEMHPRKYIKRRKTKGPQIEDSSKNGFYWFNLNDQIYKYLKNNEKKRKEISPVNMKTKRSKNDDNDDKGNWSISVS